jgi:hypothetical protein
MKQITLYDGKYTIIQQDDPYVFKALRNGEEWRDLTGDGLVLQMFLRILELEEEGRNGNVLCRS